MDDCCDIYYVDYDGDYHADVVYKHNKEDANSS